MKNHVIGILFVAVAGIAIVSYFDEKRKVNELKCKEINLTQQLDSLKKERKFAEIEIDGLKVANSKIKEKIKIIPVYIPGRFDTLSNEQLKAAMLEEYQNQIKQ